MKRFRSLIDEDLEKEISKLIAKIESNVEEVKENAYVDTKRIQDFELKFSRKFEAWRKSADRKRFYAELKALYNESSKL